MYNQFNLHQLAFRSSPKRKTKRDAVLSTVESQECPTKLVLQAVTECIGINSHFRFYFIFIVRYMERYEFYDKVCSEEFCTILKRHAVYYDEIGRLCAQIHRQTSFLINCTCKSIQCIIFKSKKDLHFWHPDPPQNFCISTAILKLEMTFFFVHLQLRTRRDSS